MCAVSVLSLLVILGRCRKLRGIGVGPNKRAISGQGKEGQLLRKLRSSLPIPHCQNKISSLFVGGSLRYVN